MTRRQIRRVREHVHDGSEDLRKQQAREELPHVEADVELLDDKIAANASAYRDRVEAWKGPKHRPPDEELPHIDRQERDSHRGFLLGAVAALLLDMGIAAFVSMKGLLLPRNVAIMVGIGVVVILTFWFGGFIRALALNLDRPRQSFARARIAAILFGVIAILCLPPLLGGRTSVALAAMATDIAFPVFSIAVPLGAAALLLCAALVGYRLPYARDHDRWARELRATQDLQGELREFLGIQEIPQAATEKGAGRITHLAPAKPS